VLQTLIATVVNNFQGGVASVKAQQKFLNNYPIPLSVNIIKGLHDHE
jgi:hypothetical protein